jgi:glutamate synthase domain-containing protein 3
MQLNRQIKIAGDTVFVNDVCGQRYMGCGMKEKKLIISGTPGNALGAYLDGGIIRVNGNAQDATGDTMNDGKIIVYGNAGDALGYAMRGGSIFVRGDAGYRSGIHMKEYKDKKPALIIGGAVGSFLGKYLAGGLIIVLGIDSKDIPVGKFTGTGLHGGKIFIRTDTQPEDLPEQVATRIASQEDIREISSYVTEFAKYFGNNVADILGSTFYVLTPNTKNPYKQMYAMN